MTQSAAPYFCDDSGLYFHPVSPDHQPSALSHLLTGKVDTQGIAAAARFQRYALTQDMDLKHCYIGTRDLVGKEIILSGLVVPCRGRAGMFFLSPLQTKNQQRPAAQLVQHITAHIDTTQINLLQVLLQAKEDLARETFQLAQFTPLAKLLYMQRLSKAQDQPSALSLAQQDITITPWSESNRSHFRRAILASYKNTADCPSLVGLRDIDDIIAGHQPPVNFKPELWFALHQEDQPVGVLLLSDLIEQRSLEIVYLGVSDNWRGRSIAKQLLAHAIGLCKGLNRSHLILAVDENNSPALGLYRAVDFLPSVRKHALIKALKA